MPMNDHMQDVATIMPCDKLKTKRNRRGMYGIDVQLLQLIDQTAQNSKISGESLRTGHFAVSPSTSLSIKG
jgi:hypothetical protein